MVSSPVDVIAHTWDHPPPRTIVLITGDSDLAYLIATLRMRKYQVVLISPSRTPASLTNQASLNLDWTTDFASSDGRRTDRDNSQPSPHPPHLPPQPPSPSLPPPPLPTTSGLYSAYPKFDFLPNSQEIDQPMVELRGMPTTKNHPKFIFPHEPDRFNIFGDLSSSFASPRVPSNMFGLGDGPLFPRSQPRVPARQARSDSAPPGFECTTHSPSLPPCNTVSLAKGKQREFPITEIGPQLPLNGKRLEKTHSTSMEEGFIHPSPTAVNAPLTSGTSTDSSWTSSDSVFSVIQLPTSSAPTSTEPVHIDNNDITESGKNPATVIIIAPQEPSSVPPKSPAVRDTEKVLGPTALPESDKAISTKDLARVDLPIEPQVPKPTKPPKPLPSSSTPPSSTQKAPSPKKTSHNAQAGPSSTSRDHVPPKFRVLVEILRQNNGSCTKSSLYDLLLKRDPNVYKNAQISYKGYITAAVTAGLVQEVRRAKDMWISVTPAYAWFFWFG